MKLETLNECESSSVYLPTVSSNLEDCEDHKGKEVKQLLQHIRNTPKLYFNEAA